MLAKNKSPWLMLIAFMIAHGVNDGFGWIIPPLLPFIREHFNLSYAEMGGIFSIFRFTSGIPQAPAAWLVHLFPASSILTAGLLWSSFGMFLTSFSTSYVALLWLSGISGFGCATYHPLSVTILSRVFSRDRLGRAIGFHLSGSGVGMVVAPLLVGLLVTRFSWRLPLQVWSGMGLLTGFGLIFFLRHHQKEVNSDIRKFQWPFFSRPLVTYILSSSTWGIAQGGILTFMALFLVDERGFQPESAAAIYGLMSLAGLVCRPFLGALMDWMGRRKPIIIFGYALSAISILALVYITHKWFIYLPLILLGIFGLGHSGLADTFMIESIPSSRREATLGLVFTIRMGVSATSPLIIGILAEWIRIENAFIVLSVLGIVAAIIISSADEKPLD
jgi:FSR family fosmidomycin resistance protein-like MFS transporter